MKQYNIYVLENDEGLIKIGITTDFEQRKRSLSGSNGAGHKIVREYVSIPTALYSLEHIMHDHFAEYRKPGSEWFEGITFESAVEYLVKLTSSDEFVKCNAVRVQHDRTRNEETTNDGLPEDQEEDTMVKKTKEERKIA